MQSNPSVHDQQNVPTKYTAQGKSGFIGSNAVATAAVVASTSYVVRSNPVKSTTKET